MRLPTEPKKGESIAHKVSEIIRYLRASTVRSVVGGKLIEGASGKTIEIPNRSGSSAAGAGGHPWKIQVTEVVVGESTELRMFVTHGAITVLQWSGSDALPSFNDLNPIIGMAQTFSDPFGGTVGHLVLSVSTTYGVWIRLGRSSGTHTSTDSEFDTVLSQGFAGSAVIITDITNVDPDDDWAYSGTYSYIFIGQVAVDASGIATIKQHLKSDLVIPLASTLPSDIVHP